MATFLDNLGRQLSQREMMEQELAHLEEANLRDAFDELQKQRRERQSGIGRGLMFSGPGARDYFRRQGNEWDAEFLKSYLTTGNRPRVQLGHAAKWSQGGGPQQSVSHAREEELAAQDAQTVTNPDIQELLFQQRLKRQGFT